MSKKNGAQSLLKFTQGDCMNSDDSSAIIALRGWHPAIARQEAISMFPESEIIRTEARRLVIANGDSDWSASEIMSGCECVLTGG